MKILLYTLAPIIFCCAIAFLICTGLAFINLDASFYNPTTWTQDSRESFTGMTGIVTFVWWIAPVFE